MKNLLTFAMAALAALILTAKPAAAQAAYKTQQLYTTGTTSIAASGTATPNSVIQIEKHLNVAIQPQFKLSGTGVGNVTFNFVKSIDGTTYETTPSVSIALAASGTNTVCGVTNVSMGAVGRLKLASVVNANTPSTATNVVVNFVIKPGQ